MSIQAVAWALEQRIPAGPKLVLVALANHADHTSGLCWPSVALVAHEASCSPRAVYRFVADLTRNGFVAVEKKRGKDGKQRSNNYWLLFDRPPKDWSAVPASHAQDAEQDDAEEPDIDGSAVHEDEPGDSLSPGDPIAADAPENAMTPGVKDEPGDSESPGPGDSGVTRQESSLEPSCLEPSRHAALCASARPTRYEPAARPSALASAAAEEARRKSKPVFVIEGTRAYAAWADHEAKRRNLWIRDLDGGKKLAPWNLVTTAIIDGKLRRGWYFPSLFPPKGGADPPNIPLTEEDSRELANL